MGRLLSRHALIAAAPAALASGCLYTEPINAPPRALIQVSEERVYSRGDVILFKATDSYDPDGDRLIDFDFEARACSGPAADTCRPVVQVGENRDLGTLAFQIPTLVPELELPTQRVEAFVAVIDEHGARNTAETSWLVGNAAPEIQLQLQGDDRDGLYPLDLPVIIVARVSDLDDGSDSVTLDWRISERPAASSLLRFRQLIDGVDGQIDDPAFELIPDAAGAWQVTVTATDPAGAEVEHTTVIAVSGDLPPCIAAIAPSAATPYLLNADDPPRRFAVLEVDDELDPYPASPLGATEFAWSIDSPATTGFVPLGGDQSDLYLDPGLFSPGDVVELRVEVADRVPEHAPDCPTGQATCSVDGNACLQRQTWRVEIR